MQVLMFYPPYPPGTGDFSLVMAIGRKLSDLLKLSVFLFSYEDAVGSCSAIRRCGTPAQADTVAAITRHIECLNSLRGIKSNSRKTIDEKKEQQQSELEGRTAVRPYPVRQL